LTKKEPDRLTDSINKSGAFLQQHVDYELQKRGWIVETEFPVQLAPFKEDPLEHIVNQKDEYMNNRYDAEKLNKAISYSQNKIELEETSIDIVGQSKLNGEQAFTLCIECKKLDPDYSDWIFFDVKRKQSMNLITKNISSTGFVDLMKIPETTNYGNEIFLQLKNFTEWDPFKHEISYSSLAISNKKIAKEVYQTKKSLVDNASRQIMKGVYGYILQNIQNQIISGSGYEHRHNVFIPIVVTTANLKTCKINSEEINPNTGFVETQPEYSDIDCIVYRCPAPISVRFSHPEFNRMSVEHRSAVSKWDVLVCSPKGFVEFLDYLKNVDLVD